MTAKNKAKSKAPTTIFGMSNVPFNRPFSCIFRYSNGQVCWPVTDFFADKQREDKSDSTLNSYIAPLQDIVNFMSSLRSSDDCFQFIGASNDMFLKLRKWLQDNTSHNNAGINKRLKYLIELLMYINDEYEAETNDGAALIRVKGDDIPNAGVEVERRYDNYGNEYFWHHSFLRAQAYTPRSPITTKAIEEISKIIEEHAKVKSDRSHYNSEVLRLSTDILEATGIRAGELVRMGQPTLELLEKQLEEDDKTLGDILKSPDSILKEYFHASEIKELLDVILTFMKEDREIIWLLVVTNKSKVNAGKPRLLPIGRSLAEDIIDFYEDYVLDMLDLDDEKRNRYNRSKCGYIIPNFEGKPFFNVKDVGNNSDDEKDGDGKLFSAFYSNKIGRIANEKASPHLFRHRFITNIVVKMLNETESRDTESLKVILHRVSRISGHGNIKSLWHYIEDGKLILNNRELVKKKQVKSQFEAICEKHGHNPDSAFAKELKALLT